MKNIASHLSGFWLITQGSNVYFPNQNLPFGSAVHLGLADRQVVQIGEWENQPLFLVSEVSGEVREWTFLRDLVGLPKEQFYLLNRGVELNHFYNTHRFCGKCGSKTAHTTDEWAVQCQHEACGYRAYPVICPSIIVAVRRGKEILLACHKRHADSKMYTTIAGFVEVGETFEQTVRREVLEETGVHVKNIQYVGSQPWAFPNSQMVGFLAEYESGDIRLQEEEIADAQWFHCDEPLPNLPPQGTIALALINATLEICRAKDK